MWIPELRRRRRPGQPSTFRRPAVSALGDLLPPVPRLPALPEPGWRTWTDIRYREEGSVGFLSFSFPGGAMSTAQCRRLLDAYREACTRPTSVLVLAGNATSSATGSISVSSRPPRIPRPSRANINAIDDLVEAVLRTTDRLVVSALAGNAAERGDARPGADEVWCAAAASSTRTID